MTITHSSTCVILAVRVHIQWVFSIHASDFFYSQIFFDFYAAFVFRGLPLRSFFKLFFKDSAFCF